MAGMAAGFGAVFGTPLAGAVFAIEVAAVGRPKFRALPACLLAAFIGDRTCLAWGVGHTHYHIDGVAAAAGWLPGIALDPLLLGKVALAAVAFGVVSLLFAESCHRLGAGLKRVAPHPMLRPALGGLAVIGLFFLCGRADYLGLGVWSPDPQAVSLVSLFGSEQIQPWSWAWKFAFTVVTVSAGFKGGEVTPLFFIGAALGDALAGLLGAPPELFAALGFVAVFAGATKPRWRAGSWEWSCLARVTGCRSESPARWPSCAAATAGSTGRSGSWSETGLEGLGSRREGYPAAKQGRTPNAGICPCYETRGRTKPLATKTMGQQTKTIVSVAVGNSTSSGRGAGEAGRRRQNSSVAQKSAEGGTAAKKAAKKAPAKKAAKKARPRRRAKSEDAVAPEAVETAVETTETPEAES